MSFQKPRSHSVESIVDEIPALAKRICKSYETIRIIGIDGFTGSGKTTLAKQLSSMLLDADVISTDGYLKPQGGNRGYLERLNVEGIKDSVDKSLQVGRRVILEGICLREVIACSAIRTDSIAHVYVKQISKNSDIWHDGCDLEDFKRGHCSLAHHEPDLSAFRYHEKFCPHELANFEYCWRG